MGNQSVSGFWIGELGALERLSMSSFLYHGHPYKLWCYDEMDAPPGVDLCDASEIVPKSAILDKWAPKKHTLQTFANLFRYELIHNLGGWWADLDMVLLRPLDQAEPYVFTRANDIPLRPELFDLADKLNGRSVQNSLFKAPPGAIFLRTMLTKMYPDANRGIYPEFGQWGTVIFSRSIVEAGLEGWVVEPLWQNLMVDSRKLFGDAEAAIPQGYCVHFYNYYLQQQPEPCDGSVFHRLRERYESTGSRTE